MTGLNRSERNVLAARMSVAAKRIATKPIGNQVTPHRSTLLKAGELLQAINQGQVNPESLKVDLCGQRITFTYFHGGIGYLTQANGRIKTSSEPRTLINNILSKINY